VSLDSVEEAEGAVRRGKAWAAIKFQENFSIALVNRYAYSSPFNIREDLIEAGTMDVDIDLSSKVYYGT